MCLYHLSISLSIYIYIYIYISLSLSLSLSLYIYIYIYTAMCNWTLARLSLLFHKRIPGIFTEAKISVSRLLIKTSDVGALYRYGNMYKLALAV